MKRLVVWLAVSVLGAVALAAGCGGDDSTSDGGGAEQRAVAPALGDGRRIESRLDGPGHTVGLGGEWWSCVGGGDVRPASREAASAGSRSPINNAMIAITPGSSISVKPGRRVRWTGWDAHMANLLRSGTC